MDDKISVAAKIRQFVRDLFGSRLVEHLEQEKFRLESMYEARLAERDSEIARLRQEALRLQEKFEEYERDPAWPWWLAQRARPTPPSRDINSMSEVPAPKTWADIQREHYEREEQELKETSNGVQNSGRSESIREQVSS